MAFPHHCGQCPPRAAPPAVSAEFKAVQLDFAASPAIVTDFCYWAADRLPKGEQGLSELDRPYLCAVLEGKNTLERYKTLMAVLEEKSNLLAAARYWLDRGRHDLAPVYR